MNELTIFDKFDRHVLMTVTRDGDPDCSCGWSADPFTYEAWKLHVGGAMRVAVQDGSNGWEEERDRADAEEERANRAEAALDAIEAMLTKKKRMGTLFDVQQIRRAASSPEGTPEP